MSALDPLCAAQVQRYLASGDTDCNFPGWPGDTYIDIVRHGSTVLRDALIERVLSTVPRQPLLPERFDPETGQLTRRKVTPMVTGLFPDTERPAVLAMLERAVVFLTPDNIESVLRTTPWPYTAWLLANLYLTSMGNEPLARDAAPPVGLSEETRCYVSLDYFRPQDRLADFVVHEAAHVFHNCKRETVGLPETRRHEWLLDMRIASARHLPAPARPTAEFLRPPRRERNVWRHSQSMQTVQCRAIRPSIPTSIWISWLRR